MGLDPTLLAVDCGTQSLRTLIFSLSGEPLARAQVEYPPYVSPRGGWAEQDPETYSRAMAQCIQQLKAEHGHAFAALAGVGITTQRATMVNLDAEGRVLRPAIVWLDQRRAQPVFGRSGPLKWGLKALGLSQRLAKVQAQGKGNWIRQNQPEIWASTHKYLQVSGYLNHYLTGEFADSIASQIGHLPFDYKKQKWAGPLSITSRIFPVSRAKLPRLVPPGEILGRVTARAAENTGLPQGLPVVACGSDKGCETLGAGVVDPTMVSLSFGTTATVQTNCRKYFEALPLMPPYPSPVPGHYSPEVEIFRGFWMISWFKTEFAHAEVARARELGVAPESLLDHCLNRTPPGALGLMTQPYWSPGLDHPDAKGAMIGFGADHNRDHVYRAIIEGLGFALREGMETIAARGGTPPRQAAVSGGASQSDAICGITADIFNLPMVRGRTHETSGLGAALLTAVGCGLHKDLNRAVDEMTAVTRVFEPKRENTEIYQALYTRVYKKMYAALAPLYRDIQEITGYPEK
ncbi:MAG: FGGY-family carbohydrate kinase [Desulfobacterales bacterium]|nr:FGGY-family carbohydrate kinase [Desulfobacterales bacterium]